MKDKFFMVVDKHSIPLEFTVFDTEEKAEDFAKEELEFEFEPGETVYIVKSIKKLTKGKEPIKVKTIK